MASTVAGVGYTVDELELPEGRWYLVRRTRRRDGRRHLLVSQAETRLTRLVNLQRPVPAPGAGLAVTCTWVLERRADPVTVAAMAAHAGWAPRTFARRFVAETGTTPLRWLAAQHLLEARLLETTELPVDQVAQRCGLGTAANLRLHLARDTGVSPTAYRRTYRGDPTRSVPGIERRTPVTVGNESSSHQP